MAKKPIIRVTFEVETNNANASIDGLSNFKKFLNYDFFECSLGEYVRQVTIEETEPAESQMPGEDEDL